MFNSILWHFKPPLAPNSIVNIKDEQSQTVGSLALEKILLIEENEKHNLLQSKEKIIHKTTLIFRDINNKVEVENITLSNNGHTLFTFKIEERKFIYKKYENVHTFQLVYHNESTKIFYEFKFNNELYEVYFDDNCTQLEILKSNQSVAKWEQVSYEKFNFKVEETFMEDVWLWFAILKHIHFHFRRSNFPNGGFLGSVRV